MLAYIPDPTTIDWLALGLAVGALVAVFRFKTKMLPTLGVTALVGAIARLALY